MAHYKLFQEDWRIGQPGRHQQTLPNKRLSLHNSLPLEQETFRLSQALVEPLIDDLFLDGQIKNLHFAMQSI